MLVRVLYFLGAPASFKPSSINLSKCSSRVFSVILRDMAVAAISRSASGSDMPSFLSLR